MSVEATGSKMVDLCTGSLAGAGQALLSAGQFRDLAASAASDEFDPDVIWRDLPDEVHLDWATWADAHANVESQRGNAKFPVSYRALLVTHCVAIAPDTPTAYP